MSDDVSIELLLDPGSEARVRADWEALAHAGLSSLAAHRSPSNRPHVTLLVRPALAETPFADAVGLLPIPLQLGDPVVFAHGDRGVLVRPVVLTDELRRLHRAVHGARVEWTPHVTLARRLLLDRLPDALALLGPAHEATGVQLRRWDAASATVTLLG